jgi:hypothetical protein
MYVIKGSPNSTIKTKQLNKKRQGEAKFEQSKAPQDGEQFPTPHLVEC